MGGLGYMLGASIADKQTINILTPVLIVPLMLFAGFFVAQDNIPFFLTPIKWISTFRYGFQAFMMNEYDGLKLECMTAKDPKNGCNPLGDMNFSMTMMETIYTMCFYWFITHVLAFCILKYKSNKYE